MYKYEVPSLKLLDKGDGENHYNIGYGYDYCNGINPNIGYGNGYYHYLNFIKDSSINNFNLIFNI